MAKGCTRGRNAPVATSGRHTQVVQGNRLAIERSFESSRLEEELLAAAYQIIVPIPGIVRSRHASEGVQNMTLTGREDHKTPCPGVQE